jgi:hypothetical protein
MIERRRDTARNTGVHLEAGMFPSLVLLFRMMTTSTEQEKQKWAMVSLPYTQTLLMFYGPL